MRNVEPLSGASDRVSSRWRDASGIGGAAGIKGAGRRGAPVARPRGAASLPYATGQPLHIPCATLTTELLRASAISPLAPISLPTERNPPLADRLIQPPAPSGRARHERSRCLDAMDIEREPRHQPIKANTSASTYAAAKDGGHLWCGTCIDTSPGRMSTLLRTTKVSPCCPDDYRP